MGGSSQAGAGSPTEAVKPLRLSPEAVVELAEAASWYEIRQFGLAGRFLQEIDQARHAIQSRPLSFPRLAGTASDLEVRRAIPDFLMHSCFLNSRLKSMTSQSPTPNGTPITGSIACNLVEAYLGFVGQRLRFHNSPWNARWGNNW